MARTSDSGCIRKPVSPTPPRSPNGTSTTIDPEWSAAMAPSTLASVAGMVLAVRADQPASSEPAATTTTRTVMASTGRAWSHSHCTAIPARMAAPSSPSRASRSASRSADRPGTRTSQV